MKNWVYKLYAFTKELFSFRSLKKFLSSSFYVAGAIAGIVGVLDVFFPNTFGFGFDGLLILFIPSFLWGAIKVVPKFHISRVLKHPETKIVIEVGDIFKMDGYLVIGMNDVFDTQKGEIIKPASIQGQFLTNVYGDKQDILDSEIKTALSGIKGVKDVNKKQGKNIRYPIGTTLTLGSGTKKYFCVAYSKMSNDLTAKSDIDSIWISLGNLWKEIDKKSQREKVLMPVIGSDLARVTEATFSDLLEIIILSFVIASRKHNITKELHIVIHPKDLGKIEFQKVQDFLDHF